MMPMLERVSNFQDFQRIFKTTKLDRGLDDTPLTDDNIAELGRDIWDELLNDSESTLFFSYLLNTWKHYKTVMLVLIINCLQIAMEGILVAFGRHPR